jgi:hypothetical protein
MELEGLLPCSKSLTRVHILSQINPVRSLPPLFFKTYLNIILQALLN